MPDVDLAAWSQAGTKEFWSATEVEADEGRTAASAAENNVRPERTRATSPDIGGLAVKIPGAN
jgi:hypothetical protein